MHAEAVADRDDFLTWVRTRLYEAELALHNGDPAPAQGALVPHRTGERPGCLAQRPRDSGRSTSSSSPSATNFSDCSSYVFELLAYDVVGDMAYTAGLEHTSASVDGEPRTYTLRATQVYRRESGEWRVAHRHGDTVSE